MLLEQEANGLPLRQIFPPSSGDRQGVTDRPQPFFHVMQIAIALTYSQHPESAADLGSRKRATPLPSSHS